jgi:hypothetical protein
MTARRASMNKPWLKIVVGILIVVLMALLSQSCRATKRAPVAHPTEPNRPKPLQTAVPQSPAREPNATPAPVVSNKPAGTPAPADPNVVAVISGYVITGEDFKKEYLQGLQPNPYAGSPQGSAPEPKAVLMQMLGDKAVILDARQKGMDQRDEIQTYIKRLREQRLMTKVAIAAVEPQISVTEQDVNKVIAQDPNLAKLTAQDPNLVKGRARIRTRIRNQKGNEIFSRYYQQLMQKLHLTKVAENLPKTAALHKRLLSKAKPESKRNIYWIEDDQIKTDLDPNERDLVLATYDGGRFTVRDWFRALCEIVPPRRPKDLDTPGGVERFLDSALQRPLLTAEAIAQGMDKDEKLVRELRTREDEMVLNYARQERVTGLTEPNDQDVAAFYEKVKGTYARSDALKVEVIWCENRDAAAKARAELDQGKDFATVQQQYAIDKKAVEPVDVYAAMEGSFWPALWNADPNQVVGPILGLRAGGLKWRVVKVKEKKPGSPAAFENAKGMIKGELSEQRHKALLDRVRAELLRGYPHQVFADRLPAFDPRNVP